MAKPSLYELGLGGVQASTRRSRKITPLITAPIAGAQFVAWVGGAERPEFVRQSDLLANIWTGLGADIRAVHAPGRHHFDVIDALIDPDSDLTQLCAP